MLYQFTVGVDGNNKVVYSLEINENNGDLTFFSPGNPRIYIGPSGGQLLDEIDENHFAPSSNVCITCHWSPKSEEVISIHRKTTLASGEREDDMQLNTGIKSTDGFALVLLRCCGNPRNERFPETDAETPALHLGNFDPANQQLFFAVLLSAPSREFRPDERNFPANINSIKQDKFRITVISRFPHKQSTPHSRDLRMFTKRETGPMAGLAECEVFRIFEEFIVTLS